MRKIINFIVLILFLTTLSPNYLYSDNENKKDDKLKLISGIQTGQIADILLDDMNDMIQKYSKKRGWDLVEELEEIYLNIQNLSDIIEYINIKPKDHEDFIELTIDIKRKRKKKETKKIIVYKDIYDTTDSDITDLRDNLAAVTEENKEGEFIDLRELKENLYYYDDIKLDYKGKELFISVLETITPRIDNLLKNKKKFTQDEQDLFYEYLKVYRLIIKNLEKSNCRYQKFEKSLRQIIEILKSLKNKKYIKSHLKKHIIFNLLFLYDKTLLTESDISTLDSIKSQLMKKSKIFDESEVITHLLNIASAIIKQKKYGAKLNKQRVEIIQSIVKKLDTRRKDRDITAELKRYIINKLIFFYDNIPVNDQDARILADLMQKNNGFDKEKRIKNISWIAAILIKKGKYSKQEKAVKEIIKELKTEIRSSSDKEFQKETLASLGSIAQYLIDKRYAQDADGIIIKFFKEVIEATKKYDIEVRTKAIGQLYGVSKKFIQKAAKKPKSLYNEKQDKIKRKRKRKTKKRTIYEVYLEKVRAITKDMMTSASKTREFEIRRKCVAELGAILIRYEEQAAKFEKESIKENLDNNSERFVKQFKNSKHEARMNATANKLLTELEEIRKKREAKQVIPEIKESDMRALVEKEEKPVLKPEKDRDKKVKLVKRKLRRKRLYVRKKRKVMLNMDPDILEITRNLVGEQYLRKMKKNKHLENNYIKHIVPLIKDLKKIERDEKIGEIKLYNGIKEFVAPILNLRTELRHLGIDKSARDIIYSFPNLKTDLNILDDYFKHYFSQYLGVKNDEHELDIALDYSNPTAIADILFLFFHYKISKNKVGDVMHYMYIDMFTNKLKQIQERFLQEGLGDSTEYKALSRLIDRTKQIDSFCFIFTTPKDILDKFKELRLVHIKDDHIIKRVKQIELNDLIIINMGLTKEYRAKKMLGSFRDRLFQLEQQGESINRDFMIGRKDIMKEVESLKKSLSARKIWPQNRRDLGQMLEDFKKLRSLTGLKSMDTDIINFFSKKFVDVLYERNKDPGEFVVIEDDEENVGDSIENAFKILDAKGADYSSHIKPAHKKLIFVLNSDVTDQANRIKELVKDDKELILLVEDKSKLKNISRNIRYETEFINIRGESITYQNAIAYESPLFMPWNGRICVVNSNRKLASNEDEEPLIKSMIGEHKSMLMHDLLDNFKGSGKKEVIASIDKVNNVINVINDQDCMNTSAEGLLFFALELNNEKLVKFCIKEGVCLDIFTEEGENLFKKAVNIAMRYKNTDIFEILVSRISNNESIFKPNFSFALKVENFKSNQANYNKYFKDKEALVAYTTLKKNIDKNIINFQAKGNNKKAKFYSDFEKGIEKYLKYLKLEDDIKKYIKYLYKDEWDYLNKKYQNPDPLKDFHKLKLLRRVNNIASGLKGVDTGIKNIFKDLILNLYDTPDKTTPTLEEVRALGAAV